MGGGFADTLVVYFITGRYTPKRPGLEVNTHYLAAKIGQMAFEAPSVFSFFRAEFAPSGMIEDAGLVAPEAQLATTPFIIGLLNGLVSLINHGLSNCERGFGSWDGSSCDSTADMADNAAGSLGFVPTAPSNPGKTIDELAVLFTGGRMSPRTRAIVTEAYTSHAVRLLAWAPGSSFGEGGSWTVDTSYDKVFDGSTTTFWDSSGDINGVNFAAAALEPSAGGAGWSIVTLRWHPRRAHLARNIGAQIQGALSSAGSWTTMHTIAACGSFDIILGYFSRIAQLHTNTLCSAHAY